MPVVNVLAVSTAERVMVDTGEHPDDATGASANRQSDTVGRILHRLADGCRIAGILRATGLTCCLLLCAGGAQAAAIPEFDQTVRINAREQPVAGFLSDLFAQVGVPVQVDPAIAGSVNGRFAKSAEQVFDDIARSFHLRRYYDGAVVHVYPANQLVHRHLDMSRVQAQRLIGSVDRLALSDADNRLVLSDLGVMLTGTPRFVEQVDELADAVRARLPAVQGERRSAPDEAFRVFPLRYSWADDVSLTIGGERMLVPGVASLLRSLIEPGALVMPPGDASLTPEGSLDGLRGQGLQAVESTSTDGRLATASRIVADPLSNSIIVRDVAERLAQYESLIRQLDVRPNMVEIEATIIDLDSDRLRELGVNWRALDEDYEILLGSGTNSDLNLFPAAPPTVNANAGGIVSLVLGGERDFIARIRALESRGAARIVSKPHVLTLANVEAMMDTSSTFFVRIAGEEEVDLFDVTVGTTLRVTPHVHVDDSGKHQIKLRVVIEDGSQSGQQVDSIPVIERSSINTQAIVSQGQSLLIGGLVREFDRDGVSGIPGLRRLPLLGALFRTSTRSAGRVERLFLITPRLTVRANEAGLRYEAPIHEGSEADIVGSANRRMGSLASMLEERDRSPSGSTGSNTPQSDDRPTAVEGDLPLIVHGWVPAASSNENSQEFHENGPIRNSTARQRDARTPVSASPVVPVDNREQWQAIDTPLVAPTDAETGGASSADGYDQSRYRAWPDEDGWVTLR